jgi:predicted RNA-binding protein YlxR (DUF448 family)
VSPRRRCVGCGRIAPRSELIRIALADDGDGRSKRVVLDPTCTMDGRGAYLCRSAHAREPAADCLTLATRRGRIARALRCGVTIDAKLIESVSR